jgi:hypothetical protein
MKTIKNRKKFTNTKRHKSISSCYTNKNYINKLITLYPFCLHDDMKTKEINKELYGEHNITYGEMTYQGIEILYINVCKKYFSILPHCFIDIGSGKGKLCLYMAEKNNIEQSIGVELVKSRYDYSIELKENLKDKYSNITNKVKFYNLNIFDVKLNKLIMTSPIFIWFSNLCFDTNNNVVVFKKIVNEIPSGSIICCSKPINPIDNCEILEIIKIPMSWMNDSDVYIYQTKS